MPPKIPLPPGYKVGQRFKTTAIYHRVNRRCQKQRYGTIIGGSRSCGGSLMVMLDSYRFQIALPTNQVEVIDV
jgi:hypothetical protein